MELLLGGNVIDKQNRRSDFSFYPRCFLPERRDIKGTTVLKETNRVTFIIEGDAEIVATNTLHTEAGIASVIVKIGKTIGSLKIMASAASSEPATVSLDVRSELTQ